MNIGAQSPAFQTQWQHAIADRQLSTQDVERLTETLQSENPELSVDTVHQYLKDLASHSADPLVFSFVPETVDFEVQGATLTDKNGVTVGARDDLQGHIESAKINVPLGEGGDDALLNGIKQQLVQGLMNSLPPGEDAGMFERIQRTLLENVEVTSRVQDGQTVYDIGLNPAFREQVKGLDAAALWAGEVWLEGNLNGPLATVSTQDGQLNIDLQGPLADLMRDPETRVPDFGPAPAVPAREPIQADSADAQTTQAIQTQVQKALEVFEGQHYTASVHGDPVGGIPKVTRAMNELLTLYNQGALEGLPPEMKAQAEHWALETAAARTGKALQGWVGMNDTENKALLQQLQSPAFRALPQEQQQRIMAQAQSTAEMLHGMGPERLSDSQRQLLATVSPALAPWQETGKTQFEGLVQDSIKSLQDQGIDLAVDVLRDGDNYRLQPQSLTLQGESLQKLLAQPPGLADQVDVSRGTLTLTPEDFKVQMGPEGLSVTLENIALEGGSDLQGPASAAEPDATGTTLTVDQASGQVQLNAEGELAGLSLQNLNGRLSGDIALDDEMVQALQAGVKTALEKMDQQLADYGLSRAQLSELLTQLPANALGDLMQSTQQGDLARLAERLGIDGSTLSQAVQFLREQPVQQVLNDLGQLAEGLDARTQVQGDVAFSLQDLAVNAGDGEWLATLGQLQMDTQNLQAVASDGERTDLAASVTSENLSATVAEDGTVTEAAAGQTTLDASASRTGEAPPVAAQIAGFQDTLRQGGQSYRVGDNDPEGRAGYLSDDRLREKKGLTVDSALALLEKAPAEAWASAVAGGPEARQAFLAEQGIPAKTGDYLLRYLETYVLNTDSTQSLSANASVEGVHTDASGTEVLNPQLNATLNASADGHESQVQATLEAEAIRTEAGQLSAEQLKAHAEGTVTETNGNHTQAQIEAGIDQLTASAEAGLQANTVQGEATVTTHSDNAPAVDVRVEGLFDQVTAKDNGLTTAGASVQLEGKADQTHVAVSSEDLALSSDAEGLDANGQLHWEVRTGGSGGHIEGQGTVAVDIEDNTLQGTRTEAGQASGTVHTDRETLLGVVAQNSPALADFFKAHGILGQNNVKIDVKNTGAVVTGANGSLEQYQVRATTSNINTPYGKASASMYIDDDGSITGDVLLNKPTAALPGLLKSQIQEALLKAEVPPEKVALVDVRLENGKFVVSLEAMKLADIGLDIQLDGDQVHVNVNQADLKNQLFNGLKNAFGLDGWFKGKARDTLLNELSGEQMNLKPTSQGNYGLTIQTRDLMQNFLGDAVQGVRLRPTFDSQGNLNIRYNIN